MSVDLSDERAGAAAAEAPTSGAVAAARGGALRVRDLDFRYPRTDAGVRGVSLDLEAGGRLAVVGESGSGKTTLVRVLLGVLRPDAGEVTLDGVRLDARSRRGMRWWRSRVQTVFQDPFSSLDPRMRVGESVAEPLRALGLATGDEARRRVREALARVGVDPDRADEYPGTFSGGQRQRVAIARALVAEPTLLIADEPVSALDMSTRASVMSTLEDITRERGMSLLLVSHDLATVAATCERIVVMEGGRVVEAGDTARVLTAPEDPYTARLIASLPRLDG